jgi:hypothetical protein
VEASARLSCFVWVRWVEMEGETPGRGGKVNREGYEMHSAAFLDRFIYGPMPCLLSSEFLFLDHDPAWSARRRTWRYHGLLWLHEVFISVGHCFASAPTVITDLSLFAFLRSRLHHLFAQEERHATWDICYGTKSIVLDTRSAQHTYCTAPDWALDLYGSTLGV